MKGSSKSELKEKAAKQMMGQIGPYIEDAEWEKSSAELRGALPEEYKVSTLLCISIDYRAWFNSAPASGRLNSNIGIDTDFKVIRKFFLKHNKSFRWHLGDYEKHNFFSPFQCL